MSDIDPVRYGVLWQKVEDYARQFDHMEKKIDKMERDIEKLLALANQAKGGMHLGKAISGAIGGVIVFVADWILRK